MAAVLRLPGQRPHITMLRMLQIPEVTWPKAIHDMTDYLAKSRTAYLKTLQPRVQPTANEISIKKISYLDLSSPASAGARLRSGHPTVSRKAPQKLVAVDDVWKGPENPPPVLVHGTKIFQHGAHIIRPVSLDANNGPQALEVVVDHGYRLPCQSAQHQDCPKGGPTMALFTKKECVVPLFHYLLSCFDQFVQIIQRKLQELGAIRRCHMSFDSKNSAVGLGEVQWQERFVTDSSGSLSPKVFNDRIPFLAFIYSFF